MEIFESKPISKEMFDKILNMKIPNIKVKIYSYEPGPNPFYELWIENDVPMNYRPT